MSKPSPEPAVTTFVVCLMREWSAGAGHWRGRIEHVQSGRHADFVGLEGVLHCLQEFGITAEDQTPICPAYTHPETPSSQPAGQATQEEVA